MYNSEDKPKRFGDRPERGGNRPERSFERTQNGDRPSFQRREKKAPSDVIFGIHAVVEAIQSGAEINRILIQKGMEKDGFTVLKETLKGKDYPLQFVPIEKINSITTSNHQGVLAFVSPVSYHKAEDLADKLLQEGKEPCFLVLDRLTDVRNFGGIARTAACMGVDAVVIPSKGSVSVTGDAMKTSAGALNHLPVCKSDLLKDTLFYLQQSGFQVVACTEKSKQSISDYSFFGPTVIVMGSEEDGISSDILKMADAKLRIPMEAGVSSLNVGVATGMVLYERIRQTKK